MEHEGPITESGEDRLAALETERDEAIDRWKRAAADFDNYKKRAAREREEYVTLANERLVKDLLPILDDLERALAAVGEHGVRSGAGEAGASAIGPLRQAYAEEATVEEGVRLVHRSLATLLERNGVREIDADGKFDPHVHEALLSQPSDAEEGSVIDVVQKGYTIGDRVVRPARVVIAAAPPEASDG
jgi:molecular chaperone GrpE